MDPHPNGNLSNRVTRRNWNDLAWTQINDGHKVRRRRKGICQLSGSARTQDARILGEDLKNWGYFDNSKAKDVLLHIDQTGTVISFVLGHGWNDEEILTAFRQVGPMLAEHLNADHIKIRLIDDHLNTRKEIQIN